MTPAGRIPPQPWMVRPETRAVLQALADGGATARFVGGCVRDALMEHVVGDIDIATDAPPDMVVAHLEKAGIKAVPTGLAHGTITAVKDRRHFEITTLRRDVETFGRHARVAFTDDWAADAARRDFTMNALFLDADGTIYDPCNGLDDLRRGRVRFVGDPAQRLAEDVLRLLRYFRFFARYDHPPADEAALAACRAAVSKLPTLSGERVRQELLKLLLAPDPVPAVRLMAEIGALATLLPEATALDRFAALPPLEKRTGARTNPLRRLAALLDVDAKGAEKVAARLRLSNAEKSQLIALVAPEVPVGADMGMLALDQALYRQGGACVRDLALLAWADAVSRGNADDAAFLRLIVAADIWQPRSFPLKGADAVKLGIPPGPAVGRLLAAIEAWWIEQRFAPDRATLLARLRELAAQEAGEAMRHRDRAESAAKKKETIHEADGETTA